MIRIPQAIFITLISATGFILLWLQRIYGSSPNYENLLILSDSSILVTFSYIISISTTPVLFIIISICGAVFAAYEHHAKLWWLLVGLITFTVAISSILKSMIMLPRPDHALIQLSTYGFPSTHAAVATVIFICGVWVTYHWKNVSQKYLISVAIAVSWFLICLSRIILDVHVLSDVLAGVLLGTAVAAISLTTAPRIFAYYGISIKTLEE